MISVNAISSLPLLFALEPFNALRDYVAGHIGVRDLSMTGDGHPILVLPGLGVSGAATADLRVRLQQLGYPVYDWKHGMNSGPGIDFEGWLALLGEHLKEIYAEHHARVSLIGWSFGGTYARELARNQPQLVRQVITLATPFIQPKGTMCGNDLTQLVACNPFLDDSVKERLSSVPPVHSTSIYSRTDGIVDWKQCIAEDAGDHRNIEVAGVSHFGMVHHPEVLKIIASLLRESASTGS